MPNVKLSPKMAAVLLYVASTTEQRDALPYPSRSINTTASLVTRGLITPGCGFYGDAPHEVTADGIAWLLANCPEYAAAVSAGLAAPAIEVGQAYAVGSDMQTVTRAANAQQGVTVYRTASNYAKTCAPGEFEAMVADGRAVLLTDAPAPVAATALETEAATDLALWLATVRGETAADLPQVVQAVRMALNILTRPGSLRPELAAAMLRLLDEQHPAVYVTVAQPSRRMAWHLCGADGQPVEAGTYADTDGNRFAIAERPETTVNPETGEPARAEVNFARAGRQWVYASELVNGWHWQPEHI